MPPCSALSSAFCKCHFRLCHGWISHRSHSGFFHSYRIRSILMFLIICCSLHIRGMTISCEKWKQGRAWTQTATTPKNAGKFLHLEKSRGTAHMGCGGWASPWENPLPNPCVPLQTQYTSYGRDMGWGPQWPQKHARLQKAYFSPIFRNLLYFYTSLTLQHSSDMPRDTQRLKSNYPSCLYGAGSVTAAASCTGACNLPQGKTLWILTSTWTMKKTPWHQADATSLVQWTWSVHLNTVSWL